MEQQRPLNWEYKKNFNFLKITEQLSNAVNTVVMTELNDINKKINALHALGLIENTEQFAAVQEQMKKINKEIKK